MLQTSMIARKSFAAQAQPSGRYCNGFEFLIRLDENNATSGFQLLSIKLPLNDHGELAAGNYVIKDNEVISPANAQHIDIDYKKGAFSDVFPDASYISGQDDFLFNLTLRIASVDSITHTVAGYIDSMSIKSRTDASRKITIKEAGINLNYNHMEIFNNGTLMFESVPQDLDEWYPTEQAVLYGYLGIYSWELFPASAPHVFEKAVFYCEWKSDYLIPYTGVGAYVFPTKTDDPLLGPGIKSPLFVTSDDWTKSLIALSEAKVVINAVKDYIFINGNFEAEAKLVVYDDNYIPVFQPDSPLYKLKGSFFQKKL